MMVEGDKWELAIPSKLAYGNDPMGPYIKPGAALFFTLELIKIQGESVPASRLKDESAEVERTSP